MPAGEDCFEGTAGFGVRFDLASRRQVRETTFLRREALRTPPRSAQGSSPCAACCAAADDEVAAPMAITSSRSAQPRARRPPTGELPASDRRAQLRGEDGARPPPVLDQNTCTPPFDESINDVPEERDDASLGHIAPGNVLRRLNERLWCVVVLAQRNVEVPTSAFLHVLHLIPEALVDAHSDRRVYHHANVNWSPTASEANAAWRVILPYVGHPQIVSTMALDPEKFYDHAGRRRRRVPPAVVSDDGLDVSPFEPDGLRVSPLRPRCCPSRDVRVRILRTASRALVAMRASGSTPAGGLPR